VVKVNERIINILKWIFLAFIIYIIYELTRKILGGSLGFEALAIALLVANLGYSFSILKSINKLDSKISGHLGWHKGKDNKN